MSLGVFAIDECAFGFPSRERGRAGEGAFAASWCRGGRTLFNLPRKRERTGEGLSPRVRPGEVAPSINASPQARGKIAVPRRMSRRVILRQANTTVGQKISTTFSA